MKRLLSLLMFTALALGGYCSSLVQPTAAQAPPTSSDQSTVCSFTAVGQTCQLANIYGASTLSVQINGGNATIAVEGSLDNTNWFAITSLFQTGTTTSVTEPIVITNLTPPVGVSASAAGIPNVRLRVTALSAATTIPFRLTSASGISAGSAAAGSVTVANTPGIVCVSGCSGGAAPTPLPVASAGAAATSAPPVVAENACAVPAGATPNVTPGNIVAQQCNVNGNSVVVFPSAQPVTFPTSQPVNCTSGCSGGAVATPLPTASAGAPATAAPPVVAQDSCLVPAGATPNVTGGNVIALQCTNNGAAQVNVVNATVATPMPTASAGISPTPAPPVVAQDTCNVIPSSGSTFNGTAGNQVPITCNNLGAVQTAPGTYVPGSAPSLQFNNGNISSGAANAMAIVPASSGNRSFILWMTFTSSVTATATFEYGTKTTNNCDTSTQVVWQGSVVPGTPLNFGFMVIPASDQFCVYESATGQLSAISSVYQQP